MAAQSWSNLVGVLGSLTLGLASSFAYAAPRASAAPAVAPAFADDLLMRPIALVVALALVSILPFVFMATTAFVKISTTLQITRSAIGAQGVPSNTVVLALAAVLSVVAMAPVGTAIADRAKPLFEEGASQETSTLVPGLVEAVREPLRRFLKVNASAQERERFLDLAKRARPPADRDSVHPDDLVVLAPAFLVTELYEAFSLGFGIYLPFLVIDLVVANILLALGMQMLQPTQVSLPFKLLLFVATDGWGVLARALVSGYKMG